MNFSQSRLWLMWSCTVLFFGYQFIMRVIPGLIMPELMQKFQIDAASFGLFASIYYLGYAGMQIPIAALLDKYGPKFIISLCALICACSTLMMIYTDHWTVALISRFLIGMGSAAGFLGTTKVISEWFPNKMYTKMVGFTFTFGLIGALYGGKPIGALINVWGFERVLNYVAIIGFFIAFFIYCIVKKVNCRKENDTPSLIKSLKIILSDKRLIIISIANLLMVGSLEGFADVWGISYLMLTRGMLKSDAALLTSTIFFGMIFGGPLLAYIAEKINSNSKVIGISGCLMAMIFVIILLFNQYLSITVFYVAMFIVGILCCYQVLVFSIGVARVPGPLAGVTVAFLNCVNMLGGTFFHNVIGQLMDLFWTGHFENNMKIYEADTYTYALLIIPITAFIGASLFLWNERRSKLQVAVSAP